MINMTKLSPSKTSMPISLDAILLAVKPVAAEFVGTALFQVFGGSAILYPAFTNMVALIILIYLTAPCGSGHLNPNVTASLLLSGHFTPVLSAAFVVAQIAGGITGAALQLVLVPDNNSALLGCFDGMHGISRGGVVLWEALSSYALVLAAHNVCLWRESFSSMGPLVIGATLGACALSGGYWTGGCLNTARLLGPAVVNGSHTLGSCRWGIVPFYLLGQVAGTLAATLTSIAVNGFGPAFRKPFVRQGEMHTPNLLRGSISPAVVSTVGASQNEKAGSTGGVALGTVHEV